MINFRTLTHDDIDEILKIENLCFHGEEWSRRMFESEIENRISVFMVGVDDECDKIVCYGCVWLIADTGEITNIAVVPSYRREGIGSMILGTLIKLCKENGAAEINLEVKEGNIPAIMLYEKYGFKAVGKRSDYYKDGSAAILMTKYL